MARFDLYSNILGSDLANEDELIVWDASAGKVKNLVISELFTRLPIAIVEMGTGAFNSLAGTTIALGQTIPVSDYHVLITNQEDSGFIGDVWVSKTDSGFTIYNSGSDASSAFAYAVIARQ